MSAKAALLLPVQIVFLFYDAIDGLTYDTEKEFPVSSVGDRLPLTTSGFPKQLSWTSMGTPHS